LCFAGLSRWRQVCELVYPGAPDVKHPKIEDYIIETLKAPPAGAKKTN